MSKTVFTFGRMNPPTIGHQKLVDKVKAEAKKQGAMPHVYLSHTQNAKKDPLDYNTKIRFARKAFGPSVTKSASKTIIQVLQELEKMGHTEATLIVGSDRVGEFKTLLNKYNGKDFTFKKLSVVSAGQRDPDAEGTAGMSATKIRGLAQAGELEEFGKGLPSTFKANDTKAIYNKVRKVMGITESVEIEDEDFEFTEQELDAFIEMTDLEGLDEQTDIDEDFETLIEQIELSERAPLTVQQRLKIGRRMKRLAPKMQRKKEIQKKKMADKPRLEKRSRKAAIKLLRTRFAGKQGANYASLSPGAKISVDRIIQKKMSMVNTISKRMLPKVRKAEMDRLKAARSSKKVVGTANEAFEAYLEEACWDGYKKVGMKKKGEKIVPDCVPEEVILEDEDKETNQKLLYMLRQAFTDATERQLVIRALKGGQKSLQNPKLRPFILKLLNRLLDATQSDPTMFVKMKDRLRRMAQDDSKKETDESLKVVESFKTKSAKSGVPLDIIFECFLREEDSSRGFDRVNSFIAGGKAWEIDKDLASQVREEVELDETKTHFVYQKNVVKTKTIVHRGDEKSSREWISKNSKHYDHEGKNFVIYKGKPGNVSLRDVVEVKSPVAIGKKPIFDPKSTEFRNVSKKQKKLDQTSNEDVDAAKDKIAREKEADKVKHDRMIDQARTRETQAKNRSTNESLDDVFTAFLDEEGGAGEFGTSKLKKKYSKDTPYAEETYDGNEFEEAYGMMWFNEDEELDEAEYQGNKVTLGKPSAGDVKKFKVYVKNEKGNVVKVNFGDPNSTIKKHIPARRKSFRARHNCDNPGPRTKARYWSCKNW